MKAFDNNLENKNKLTHHEQDFLINGKNTKEKFDYALELSQRPKNDFSKEKKSFLDFGLPIFSSKYDELIEKIKQVRYRIDTIQFRLSNKSNYYLFTPYNKIQNNNNPQPNNVINNVINNAINNAINNTVANNANYNKKIDNNHSKNKLVNHIKREIVFKIIPDVQNDIYHLYCLNALDKEVFFDTAFIPNFTTSVMMNKLFRNIKENDNLDKLEESDDEEEFENEKEDRFVYLERSYNMACLFNNKFKKWYPIKLASDISPIVQETKLKSFCD
jgi:hypothetical protein